MNYLPEPKVHAATRWAYAGCPGVGTEDLMRAPYDRPRKLQHWPDRMSDGRSTVRVSRRMPCFGAYGLAGWEYVAQPRPFAKARVRPKAAAKPAVVRPTLTAEDLSPDGRPVVLSDVELMAKLGIRPAVFTASE